MNIFRFFLITKLTFVKKKREHRDITTFYFEPSRPLKHVAGQHGIFILPAFRGVRPFSISSAPEEKYVTFTTHVRESSRFKQYIDHMKKGDRITMLGPVMNFTLRKRSREHIFLAQGIGITPFRSMLVHSSAFEEKDKITLIHVDSQEHTFKDLTSKKAFRARYPKSPEEYDLVLKNTVSKNAHYYLSGGPKFVSASKKSLAKLGIDKKQIHLDNFWGY